MVNIIKDAAHVKRCFVNITSFTKMFERSVRNMPRTCAFNKLLCGKTNHFATITKTSLYGCNIFQSLRNISNNKIYTCGC